MINNNILTDKLSISIRNTLILTINPFLHQFLHFICWSTCRHLEFLQTLGQSGVPRSLGSKVILHHLNKFPSSLNDSQETLEDPGFAIRTRPIFWNKKPWLSTHILCTVILREIMLWNHGSLFNVMHYSVDNNIINGFRLFFSHMGTFSLWSNTPLQCLMCSDVTLFFKKKVSISDLFYIYSNKNTSRFDNV